MAGVALTTTLEGFLQLKTYSHAFNDIRFWTTALQVASLGIVFAIHELEHERSRVPSGTVLVYWLFYLGTTAIKIRSLYTQNFTKHESLFAMVATNFVLAFFVFVLELAVPKKQSVYRRLGDEKECPGEYANIFSTMTFGWMTTLMRQGYKNYLTSEDLWDLPPRALSKLVGTRIWTAWRREKKGTGIWTVLFKTYGKGYLRWVPLKMGSDLLGYMQPQLLRLLINFIGSYSTATPDPAFRGFLIAGTMFCVSVSQSIGNNNFMNYIFEMSMTVRAGLVAIIYKKSLRLSNKGRASKSTGDIVNLMVSDGNPSTDAYQLMSFLGR